MEHVLREKMVQTERDWCNMVSNARFIIQEIKHFDLSENTWYDTVSVLISEQLIVTHNID